MLNLLALTTLLIIQTPVTVPDTPAGRGLTEFVASFNAGGEARKVWLAGRTNLGESDAAGILEQDAAILAQHGAMTVVRVATATPTSITAILRHAKSGAHGHLTLDAASDAPYQVTNMQLRAATAEEIGGK